MPFLARPYLYSGLKMAALIGTLLTAEIVPTDTQDTFPTHVDIYGKGGYRTVASTVERDAIPAERRSEGMLVRVIADSKNYVLSGGILNANWIEFAASGGATIGDIKQGLQANDHNGWIKLNGRAKSTLTTTQQAAATSLGIGTSIPNAAGAYLSQTGTTLGGMSYANTKNIAQNNLPNVTLGGSAAAVDISHSHSWSGSSTSGSTSISHTHTLGSTSVTTSSINLAHSHTQSGTFTSTTNGYHNHTIGPVLHAYTDGTQGNGGDGSGLQVSQTGYDGSHTHSITLSGSTGSGLGSHSHTLDLSASSTGSGGPSHSHSVSMSGTTGAGGSTSHSHSITTASLNGAVTQVSFDLRPLTMSVNMFLYLGL